MPKYIFVTGGVVSSVGKGITTAALGRILKSRRRLRLHPEARPLPQRRSRHDVAVPARRGLRHERRRRDRPRPRPLRALHRRGPDAGQLRDDRARSTTPSSRRNAAATSSAAPSRRSRTSRTRSRRASAASAARPAREVVIIEVGGTVGDIEGQVFLEAIRQMRREEPPRRHALDPRHLPALHRRDRRAQDEADAALRAGAAAHGYPAGRHPLPRATTRDAGDRATRSPCSATSSAAPSCRADRAQHLRSAARARRRGPRRLRHRAA